MLLARGFGWPVCALIRAFSLWVWPTSGTLNTASRATAVQIVHSNRRGSREIEHIGRRAPGGCGGAEGGSSAAAARRPGHTRLRCWPTCWCDAADPVDPVPSCCGDVLGLTYGRLGFDAVCGRDEVFKALVLARLIEPTSKLDSIRVLVLQP
jgi:hypothetical protein